MTVDAAATPMKSKRPSKILVAEDEPDIRDLLACLLEIEGHQVVVVGDGRAAILAANESEFALAVLDVTMPVLDGLSAAKALKESHPRLLIVMHTAMDESWVRQHFSGYDDYFRKPLDPDAFLLRVTELIS